ncbi:MAG: TAXI family TRAP transporter solute-binding subunit [Pseudomonadota bacterium]
MTHPIRTGLAGLLAAPMLVAALAMPAAAQTVALGTTKGGATAQIANAIANVVSEAAEVQMRPQVMANTAQYIPVVNEGRIEFGVANLPQTFYAISGTGMSKTANPDLRVVASLFPFQAGIVVPESLGAENYADLSGTRVPRFPDNSLGDFIIRAALNAGGLSYADVEEVPVANFPRMWEAMKQGQTDLSIAAVGSRPTFDLEAALGDIQFLAFAPEDEAAVAELLPGAFLRDVAQSDDLPGLDAASRVFAYDYLLFANKDVPDAVVRSVAKALFEGAEALKASSPLWRSYDPMTLGKDIVLEYHPAALAYYEEVGAR